MKISQLQKLIHANAKAKGFHDKEHNKGELLMLVVSELGEALEADRKGRWAEQTDIDWIKLGAADEVHLIKEYFPAKIKDTFQDEIADAVIRLLDISELYGIDLEFHIKAKMEFNATRERLHGKKY